MTQPLSSGAVSYQNAIIRTDYLDGLGRPQQTVSWRAAGYKDLADFTQYNERGKPCRSWLPTVSSSADGSFIPLDDLENLYSARYPDASVYYSTVAYEATPTADICETRAPGAWQGHDGVRTERPVSDATGMLAAMRFTVNSDGALVKSGSYVSGELTATKVTDEDEKVALDFVDKDGHTVLKRSVLCGTDYADTYMVYDIYGNLCYVLPPMASFHIQSMADGTISDTNEWLSKYCYLYKWDYRNRMTEKRLPGCDPIYMVYDKCDQLVYSQDGNQRCNNLWTLSAYDAMGRLAYTAQVTDTRTADQLRQAMATVSPRVSFSASGTVYGYLVTGNATVNSILSVNYYDSYDFITNFASAGGSALAYQAMSGYDGKYVADVPSLSARGMLTGTVTRVLGDTTMLVRSLYYDHHGNVIQSHETNALGGTEHTYSHLTFTGKPLQVMQVHTTADTTMTDVYSYTYDNMERLLTASVSHDGGMAVQLAQNTYNQLGQLYRQYLGMGIDGITFYSYNVRGWTTLVNNSNFRQTLHYQDTYGNATPCFNGNISAMEWREKDAMMASTPTQHHYCYTYDGLNRLTAADYGATDGQEWNGSLVINGDNPVRDYDCTYGYDLNGNLTSLTRKGVRVALAPFDYTYWTYGTIDDLSLTYNGNQLKNATDQSTNVYPYEGLMDFKDGANQRVEYTWDANGNMTMDANKGITRIKYNVLNLPQEITYSDRHIVRYKYAADGRKLRTEYLMSMVPIINRGEDADSPSESDGFLFDGLGLRDPIGGGITPIDSLFIPAETTLMVRDYCGNHIYRDRVLERINNDYGYWADGNWYYYIKDYQGNVRAVINHAGTLKEVNNYYPYGALMGGGTVGNNASFQPYKYGTKELDRQNGLDWYDSQARQQDPLVPRFTTIDPMSEKYYNISPYAYCAGNPIKFVDPTGTEIINGDGNIDEIYRLIRINESYLKHDITEEQRERLTNNITKLNNKLNEAIVTQKIIDDFKATDPDGFEYFNNLKYRDNENEEHILDINVKSGGDLIYMGGKTIYDGFNQETGRMPYDMINVQIFPGFAFLGALAHEFGHVESFAASPLEYYNEVVSNPYNDCQDPTTRNPRISNNAIKWQNRYMYLKNEQFKKRLRK